MSRKRGKPACRVDTRLWRDGGANQPISSVPQLERYDDIALRCAPR